jgi:hypothetical protein
MGKLLTVAREEECSSWQRPLALKPKRLSRNNSKRERSAVRKLGELLEEFTLLIVLSHSSSAVTQGGKADNVSRNQNLRT